MTPEPQAPAWLLWPARVLAVVVVVPLRLGWHAITAVRRGMGRLIDRAVVRPVAWAWRYLVAVPLTWLWSEVFRPVSAVVVRSVGWLVRYLLVVPVRWLGSALSRLGQLAGRVLAVLIVAPLRLLGRGLAAVLRGVGRLLDRAVRRPVAWLWHHLVVVPVMWLWQRPLTWVWHHLVVVALTWLREGIVWTGLRVGRLIGWLWRNLVWQSMAWLVRYVLVVPVGLLWRALTYLWDLAGRAVAALARFLHRYLVRPVGLVVSWFWRYAVTPVWRVLVLTPLRWLTTAARGAWTRVLAPVGRWWRDDVWRPVGQTLRSVWIALGLRRRLISGGLGGP